MPVGVAGNAVLGAIYVLGNTAKAFDGNTMLPQEANYNFFLSKFDYLGNKQWTKQFGAPEGGA